MDLVPRLMDGITTMFLCFCLILKNRYTQRQGSLIRYVVIPLQQPLWNVKGFNENEALAWLFLGWSSHSDVLEYSILLKTVQSLVLFSSSSASMVMGWDWFPVLYLLWLQFWLFVLTRYCCIQECKDTKT